MSNYIDTLKKLLADAEETKLWQDRKRDYLNSDSWCHTYCMCCYHTINKPQTKCSRCNNYICGKCKYNCDKCRRPPVVWDGFDDGLF